MYKRQDRWRQTHVEDRASTRIAEELRMDVAGLPGRDGSQTVAAISVSYTHLRAHETVLDLVCRLLLEKKTHNTKKKTKNNKT